MAVLGLPKSVHVRMYKSKRVLPTPSQVLLAVGVTHIALKHEQGSVVFGWWASGSRGSSSPRIVGTVVRELLCPAAHFHTPNSGLLCVSVLAKLPVRMRSVCGPTNTFSAPGRFGVGGRV